MTPEPAPPPFLSTLAPALFGDVGGHGMVMVDLRAETGGADPLDAIRAIVERGDAACLCDREGIVSDCVVGRVDGAVFVVTPAGRATFSDLSAALRHGLSRPVVAPEAPRPPRRLRRLFSRLKAVR